MKTIKRAFVGDRIVLDFHEYIQCSFTDCDLVYYGYSAWKLENCSFDQVRVSLDGPAGEGLHFLSAFKNGGQAVGEDVVNQILTAARLL